MATQNIFDLTDTWNAGGTTFTAVKMNVTDTASAAGSLLMDLQVGGSSKFTVSKIGSIATTGSVSAYLGTASFWIASNTGWIQFGASPDLILARDAADTLAQRRSTNAQAFRVYGTFTDASNYERGVVQYANVAYEYGSEIAGTGAARNVRIKAAGGANVLFATNGSDRWAVGTTGHFIANADNTYDIGASGANRPRNLFVGGYLSIGDGITAPGAGTGQARIYVDTADGDLKVVFADGTVKTIVTDT